MRRILVLSLAGIGDTLMATPILHELRVQFPEADLRALVLWRGAAGILEGNPHVDAVHQHDFANKPRKTSLRYTLWLRKFKFDASFNIHPQGRREYRLIARLIGARRRFSHSYENASLLDRCLVTDLVPQDYTVHAIENNLRLLEKAGLTRKLPRHDYELYLSAAETDWADKWIRDRGLANRVLLGIHLGSGGTKNLALRRWPVDRYADLFIRLLADNRDIDLVLFGGPDEEEAHEEMHALVPDPRVRYADSPSLRHAAALVSRCAGFLSVDTVFMHLASAVRVPRQWVIETPTLNPVVAPRRDDWIRIPNPGVKNPLDWYRYDGRPISGTPESIRRCMESVSVNAVHAALMRDLPPVRNV